MATKAEKRLIDAALVYASHLEAGRIPDPREAPSQALLAAARGTVDGELHPAAIAAAERLELPTPPGRIRLHPSGPVKGGVPKPFNPNRFALADDNENSFYKFKTKG